MAAKHGSHGLILCFVPTRIESLAGLSQRKDSYSAGDHGEFTPNPNHFYDLTGKVALFVVKGQIALVDPRKC
jgi:hypothetical protein